MFPVALLELVAYYVVLAACFPGSVTVLNLNDEGLMSHYPELCFFFFILEYFNKNTTEANYCAFTHGVFFFSELPVHAIEWPGGLRAPL